MEELYTSEQVAKILKVHQFTVLKFIRLGKLKASKLGRVYRIRQKAIEEFLDNQLEKGTNTKKEVVKEKKETVTNKSQTKTKTKINFSKKKDKEEKKERIDDKEDNKNDHYILTLK